MKVIYSLLCSCLCMMLVPSFVQASTQRASSSTTILPGQVRGVQAESDPSAFPAYTRVSWLRLPYPTCGWGKLTGTLLKQTIQHYHQQGVHILLTVCQGNNDSHLLDTQPLQDAAQGQADAIQCGNEEMKTNDPSVSFLHIPPDRFAHFYDLCEKAMHAANPNAIVLLGSLDPHVGGIDFGPLGLQVQYLDAMQAAMNSAVHPGGNWNWRAQTLGLIDSWHNGYPDANTNSLYGLFVFWAQQFQVNLNTGGLGAHLWVVEGTGCFMGCGINTNNAAQEATVHVVDLITNVLTVQRYGIPYFHFSGNDFFSNGITWPIGIRDIHGRAKPLRQDLPMGARSLNMSCANQVVHVITQEDLLGRLYTNCSLPASYIQDISR